MCGSFSCLRNSLISLNIFYVLVSFILIGVATYGKAASMVTSLPTVGGIVACGFFLLIVALMGLIGSIRHHQVTLFFYMIILFLIFIIQFSIACVCLAASESQQRTLAEVGWKSAPNETIDDFQKLFGCCGFDEKALNDTQLDRGISCPASCGSDPAGTEGTCPYCYHSIHHAISYGFRVSGGIGLFFSFTEIVGFVLAYKYRHIPNPAGIPKLDLY